jgi:putative FmdB family regulatory protein
MPLYEYECERGHRFERIVKYSDPPIAVCPECGAAVHKLMSSPAIQFKGSGFYITDYARKGSGEGKDSTDTKSTKSSSEAGESKESKDSKDSKETKTEKAATTESSTASTSKSETSSTPSTKSD